MCVDQCPSTGTPCRELIVVRGALGVGPQRVVVVVVNGIDRDDLHEWTEISCENCRTSHTPMCVPMFFHVASDCHPPMHTPQSSPPR